MWNVNMSTGGDVVLCVCMIIGNTYVGLGANLWQACWFICVRATMVRARTSSLLRKPCFRVFDAQTLRHLMCTPTRREMCSGSVFGHLCQTRSREGISTAGKWAGSDPASVWPCAPEEGLSSKDSNTCGILGEMRQKGERENRKYRTGRH